MINEKVGNITLNSIVSIIDGENFLEGCIVGFPNCSDEYPCPVHKEWINAKNEINKIFNKKNVNQFSEELYSKLNYMAFKNNKKSN